MSVCAGVGKVIGVGESCGVESSEVARIGMHGRCGRNNCECDRCEVTGVHVTDNRVSG